MSQYVESHVGMAEQIPVISLLLMLPTTDVFVLLSISNGGCLNAPKNCSIKENQHR